jgi:hypothetical protein
MNKDDCLACKGTGDSRCIPHQKGVAWNRADMGCTACNGTGKKSTSYPIPKKLTVVALGGLYGVEIPQLRLRIGPIYDGSGRKEYPNGVIRTGDEARQIADMLVVAWNKTYGGI